MSYYRSATRAASTLKTMGLRRYANVTALEPYKHPAVSHATPLPGGTVRMDYR